MSLADALAAIGPGELTEDTLHLHVFPLFSKTLAAPGIYLANHSLGRPLNQTEEDLREGFHLWQASLGAAWGPWLEEEHAHRTRLAQLIGASRSHCIVPKTSAGQGLRTVLNALPGIPRVVSTTGEFDSIDVILKQYAALGRIALQFVSCEVAEGGINLSQLMQKIHDGVDLVVISQVMFMTGQVVPDLDLLAEHCHKAGARLLVDAYHAVGVFSIDVARMKADFMIGGSYKYLRGGPGAAFLYISPDALSSGLKPIDIGWFAKDQPFLYDRPDPPRFAHGGDAFLESTPPILTYYQARAGQQFALHLGVTRIRAYCIDRLSRLKRYLADVGIAAEGADDSHGGFLTIENTAAVSLAETLERSGITTDARGNRLRLSPDYLTSDSALREVATTLASISAAV
ncbi:aminotransferase class V-fold PLP-dependent enzyme [Tunturiibacter gelidoferens]|uniref:Kynureninase n=1 Tax=Tunturiibacter gelidiferens TaxID=3069689 RepID=A0ACC5P2R0_9BACT|nr:aminotransferase class V-fold PLP-dependent enzyme [Edaphobacter lichenicola]MBB5341146.1 kynureninase [Edaphobacter lichenicola]